MKFLRPKGAVKDFKELEYLVALHQTSHAEVESFVDGSVDAQDVRAFLLSRYGIQLTETQVREVIFKGLAGGDGVDEAIDIMEIVAILMIPMLVKVSDGILGGRSSKNGENGGNHDVDAGANASGETQRPLIDSDKERLLPPETIIEDVLRDILRDTTDGAYDVDHPPPLTPALLKQIFLEYDELELVQDDALIHEMIEMCRGSFKDDKLKEKDDSSETLKLDTKAFAKALTNDTNLYNPENETRYSEVYDDVFPDGIVDPTKPGNMGELEYGTTATGIKKGDRPPSLVGETFQQISMFSHMDYTADNFVHVIHVIMVWLVVVFSYFWYMNGVSNPEFLVDPDDSFGSRVGFAIFRWTVTMLKLVLIGSISGFLLALGNGLFQKSVLEPIVGLASVAGLVFLPYFVPEKNFVFNTNLKDSEHKQYRELNVMMLIFGIILIIVQLKNIVTIVFGKGDLVKKNRLFIFMENILGSNVSRAYRSKQAAIVKVNQMARNAYELHQLDTKDIERTELKREVSLEALSHQNTADGDDKKEKKKVGGRSSRQVALQKYADLVDETEEVGGVMWAWRQYISGDLAATEGIWLPSRLLAANAILFVTVVVVVYVCIDIFSDGISELDKLFNSVRLKEVVIDPECFSEFNYSDCYFPFEEASYYTGVAVCRDMSLSGPGCRALFQPIDPESTFGSAIGSVCESFEAAFAPFEKTVADALGGASCPYILDAAKPSIQSVLGQFNFSADRAIEIYNSCYRISYMDEEDISKFNEWFDDDKIYPDITNKTLMECESVRNIVTNETFVDSYQGRENAAFIAFEICMDVYKSLDPAPFCKQPLYYPTTPIISYEQKWDNKTEFCATYVSLCVPDLYNPSRGTCIVGEADGRYYRFEGSTCEDYPSINKTLNHYKVFVEPTQQSILDLFPASWMLTLTATIGVLSGFIAAVSTCLVYIPSSIHTVMKFRSGVIPSLKDPKFLDYRKDLHNQTYMIGSMFWGLIVSTAMVTFFTAGITFLLVWPTTRPFVVNIAAQVLGIVITILVKIILCFLAMRTAYAGFYRTKPMFANIFCFALECWNLALTLALVAGRLGKFIVLTSFYIGRIDRPVLADGLFLKVDNLPVIFYQNLISTDSHRHPYVEQLSVMYLMKLRHRENFGSRAGSIWRLLFVSALMPWLKKKRIQDDDVDIGKLRSFISNGNQGSSKQIEVEQDQVKESSLEKVEETKLEDL